LGGGEAYVVGGGGAAVGDVEGCGCEGGGFGGGVGDGGGGVRGGGEGVAHAFEAGRWVLAGGGVDWRLGVLVSRASGEGRERSLHVRGTRLSVALAVA